MRGCQAAWAPFADFPVTFCVPLPSRFVSSFLQASTCRMKRSLVSWMLVAVSTCSLPGWLTLATSSL